MAKVCDKCGRGKTFSRSRSKSNIITKRTHEINLQVKKVNGKRMKICTKCLKTLAKAAK
ncbi:50S ribosomal protein L28 [Candidatus Saccharibacteria bacterium]|nr:50S ribosomal protein L28 [Candidatus Saccharibacteria bacterium]NIV03841.1 50S ribosomal protein L28 [Calditrichia bacterium]NIS38400.1 50S ribosomal protein L28 [Candidatus Saccharibacteria bacterium]NIV72176.1 50S ribosomal protein L28 [Calditrichia bacterium]NIV99089.1 50S ribosomal protein L28 [Candidatus Saccharibacteria bacterium]